MITIPTNEELRNAYEKAPEMVQKYITSEGLAAAFEEIRMSNKLHLDEAGRLSQALNAVFLELRTITTFPELLRTTLEQNSNTYDAVLKAVNEKIFEPFRALLQPAPDVVKAPVTPPQPPVQKETPSPVPTVSGNILDRKITQSPEKISVDVLKTESIPPVKPPSRSSIDPYREPIE
ncbi:MAG: hypothetical protein AAB439_00400 [Patescibacteria group bacterium]